MLLPVVLAAKESTSLLNIVPFKIDGFVIVPSLLTAKPKRFAVVQVKVPRDTVGSTASIKNGLLAFIFVLISLYYFFRVYSNRFSTSKAYASTNSSGSLLNALSNGFVKNRLGFIPLLNIERDIKKAVDL